MAAGLGYVEFATGDVLTATAANGYLASQVVMVFADSSARTTAITSPQEGMVSYLKDTNAIEYYSGSAWVGVSNPGDITAVTAGTGISGGGTTGDVTITNSMATAIDAKGDLVVGTGADAFSRLAVGTNNQVLTADSSTATGLKWATPAAGGGGKVLQVVQASSTTATTIATTTYTDTTLTATITPSATTSKILVLVNQQRRFSRSSVDQGIGIRILRGATSVFSAAGADFNYMAASTTGNQVINHDVVALTYLDSPATTSATTYKTQGNINDTSSSGSSIWQQGSNPSTITLIEIGA